MNKPTKNKLLLDKNFMIWCKFLFCLRYYVITQICSFADCENNEIPMEQNLEIKVCGHSGQQ